MRLIAATAALLALTFAAPALAQSVMQRIQFADPAGKTISAAVWTPETPSTEPRALVVMSHGNGGAFGGHQDTAEALAEAGFVVAALTHPGDNYLDMSRSLQLTDRPPHVSALITYMTDQWRGAAGVDKTRIGAFGFSVGGFTVLTLAVSPMPERFSTTARRMRRFSSAPCSHRRRWTFLTGGPVGSTTGSRRLWPPPRGLVSRSRT